ncbi:MAG TPA: LytTR family DNA-binding domain-containing protein [Gemmatimonas sp.]|nr:LytTR family DNA-binding domain-containing protein [Gemmatimonas sp.]
MTAHTGTSPLRIVVADDEPIAAESLAAELRRLGCEVVAITRGGAEAIAACAKLRPAACFTDVSMPGTDGLAVARALREAAAGIRVVFVSAHPHFAVEAYAADVVDFVLKPLRRSRLAEAVDRVHRARSETDDGDRLLVPERGAVHLVPIRDIEWVQADGYYLWLHTPQRAWMLRERMHRLEARLETAGFLRVHRSAMVRRTAVTALDVSNAAEPCVVLRSGARTRVARDRLHAVRAGIG